MKLLFATGRSLFPFFRGGDGTTIAQLLASLTARGIKSVAVGKLDPAVAPWSLEDMVRLLSSKGIPHAPEAQRFTYHTTVKNCLFRTSFFLDGLQQVISEFKPDVILTQLEDSHEIIALAHANGIPAVLYVHDATPENHTSLSQRGLTYVLYNSAFIADQFRQYSNIPWRVAYPLVDAQQYNLADTGRDPYYVTMVNPAPHKGALVLESCCAALPYIPFQVVLGWSGSSIDFSRFSNVTVLPFGTDMRNVYARTKFAIVPSQWSEPFGRIPVEAGIGRIPTIASRVGGLPESAGDGGLLLFDFKDSNAWQHAIADFYDSPQEVERLGGLAKVHAQQFTMDVGIASFMEVLSDVVA